MGTDRELLALQPIADHSEVGRWLSAMQDARRDTLAELENVTDDMVDRRVTDELNTIGTLLYHIALIEADWLLDDILGERSAWPSDLLPFGDRDPKGVLTEVSGEPLAAHVERLAAVRSMLLDRLRPMSVEDFHTVRARERYDVSPAWVRAAHAKRSRYVRFRSRSRNGIFTTVAGTRPRSPSTVHSTARREPSR